VLVAGSVADKPSRLVAAGEPVRLSGPRSRFVSRGGEKLAAALRRFGVEVTGRQALDAGASTGGFTDCLLQHGAAGVTAVDVGHGQLDPGLRADPRVRVLERTNVRHLTPDALGLGPCVFDLVTADLAFISLRSVVPVLLGPLLRPGGDILVLVKPQFEAGRVEVSRGRGVVRDRDVHRRALETVAGAMHDGGAAIRGAMASPITGHAGNVEFLLYARKGGLEPAADELEEALVAAVNEAHFGGQG
jgi:23S rRNA (cytidine1920-2'-O)/16S rRNA (cytidine1409-2'-O)-methyltransferase